MAPFSHPAHRTATCRSPASGLYGAFLVKGFQRSTMVSSFLHFLGSHSFVRPAPQAFFRPDRKSNWRSRAGPVKDGRHADLAKYTAAARPLLDRSEHGGLLWRSGAARLMMIRGEPAFVRKQSRHKLVFGWVQWSPTMKQSYASAGKAPRRRVHSLSGIAAIAEFGLPPPRIVIGSPSRKRSRVPNSVVLPVGRKRSITSPAAARCRPAPRRS